MKTLILCMSIAVLSLYKEGVQALAINCSFQFEAPIAFDFINHSDIAESNIDLSPVSTEIASNEQANICHYSVATGTISVESISVSSAISVIEQTNKFGRGTCDIPTENIKRSISFDDNRVAIDYEAKNGWPFSAMGIIKSTFEVGATFGTIFMAPGNLGITSAHCVLNDGSFPGSSQTGFQLQELNGSSFTFEYGSNITDIFIPNEYYSSPYGPDYDWAVVKFADSTLESSVGSLSIGSGFSLYDTTNTIVGFPKDKNFVPQSSSGHGVISCESNYYELYQFVNKGMSGGPLFFNYFNPSTLDEYMVVAGVTSQLVTYQSSGYTTRATRISNSLISLVRLLK